ncbi:hypothetical protein Bca52824_037526 [Brassica carinata]|uniref:Uncharacterized protein n=1 Tax=Brassica carinata TaxID=52824 RepID=A0A8X7RMY7_BRACI|nr:hypothetical protein Bca52824_037526 [Brassica carinata]
MVASPRQGELFPFISASGNSDVIDSDQFFREDEKNDERVGRIVALINAKQDWSEFEWEVQALPRNVELSDSEEGVDVGDVTETHVEEPSHVEELAVVARRGKRKMNDPGAEAQKKQLLCQWAAEHNSGISGQMKTFIEGLFTSLKEVVQKDIEERFDKVDKEMAQLKEVVSKISGPSDTMGKERASEILCPSARMEKDQWRETSQSLSPSAAKEKGKGKAAETGVPTTVRRRPRPRKEIETDDMLDFLKNLSQSSKNKDMATQEYLQEAVGNLSQASHVRGFDPSQKSSPEEAVEISTPLSSFKPADYKTLSLKDTDLPEDRVNDIDYSLVFVPEDSWVKLRKWCSTSKQHLKIGSSVYTSELAARVMGPAVWLQNDELHHEITDNGLRIKNWRGSSPSTAVDITYEDIMLTIVKNPIIIDQSYGSRGGDSKVAISNVLFKNVRGTTITKDEVQFRCSKSVPCKGVSVVDVELNFVGDKGGHPSSSGV